MGTVVTGSFSPTLPAATSVVVSTAVVRRTPLDYIAGTTPYGPPPGEVPETAPAADVPGPAPLLASREPESATEERRP
jgi:hypothetical protein